MPAAGCQIYENSALAAYFWSKTYRCLVTAAAAECTQHKAKHLHYAMYVMQELEHFTDYYILYFAMTAANNKTRTVKVKEKNRKKKHTTYNSEQK